MELIINSFDVVIWQIFLLILAAVLIRWAYKVISRRKKNDKLSLKN